MTRTKQLLAILKAEASNYVNVSITLTAEARDRMMTAITEAFCSSGLSEAAKAWNEERTLVVEEAIDAYLTGHEMGSGIFEGGSVRSNVADGLRIYV